MTKAKAPKGVYAAVSTPVDGYWKPDLARYLDHCQWLLDHGCDGLAPLGTTGEATSLGLNTKLQLIKTLQDSNLPMNRMIIGTGSTSIDDTIALSETALDAGASGLLMLPPFYYSSPSSEGLFRFFCAVAERLTPRKPQIFLYHIPMFTGVPITVELTDKLRREFPNTFVGIKDSGGDFSHTLAFLKAFPDFAAFSGSETLTMQNLVAGGWGSISATANFTAPAVARRVKMETSDSRALDRTIAVLRERVASVSTVSGTKACLALLKDDPEWQRTLPPNTSAAEHFRSLPALFESLEPRDELIRLYGTCIFH